MPAVDAAVRSLTSASPIRVEDAGRHLKSQGISHGQVDIAVFVGEWLPMLGRRGLEVVELGGSDWIIRPELGTAAHQLEVAGYFPSETEKQICGVRRSPMSLRRTCEPPLGSRGASDRAPTLKQSGSFGA